MLIDYQKVNIYQDDEFVLKEANFKADEGEFVGAGGGEQQPVAPVRAG